MTQFLMLFYFLFFSQLFLLVGGQMTQFLFFILFFTFFPIICISWRPNDPVSSEAQEWDVRALWLTRVVIQQRLTQHCKAVILQLYRSVWVVLLS